MLHTTHMCIHYYGVRIETLAEYTYVQLLSRYADRKKFVQLIRYRKRNWLEYTQTKREYNILWWEREWEEGNHTQHTHTESPSKNLRKTPAAFRWWYVYVRYCMYYCFNRFGWITSSMTIFFFGLVSLGFVIVINFDREV